MNVPSPRETRTRRAILDAAAALLSTDASASLAEVATAAGLGRTTVHRYYATREALLSALAAQALDRLDAAVVACRLDDGPAPAVLRRVARNVVPMADELRFLDVGPDVWELPEMADRWTRFADRVEALVERGRREGDLRTDVPTAFLVDLFAGALETAGMSIRDGRVAPGEAADLLADVLLQGAAR